MSNIREIAALAGVSTCTVSRYLNHKITVKPETEARLKAAIAQLGYVPSSVARSLKTNQTMNAAVILPQINNLYYPEILSGIGTELEQADYAMVIHQVDDYRGVDQKCFKRVYASRVDGVIVVGYQRRHDQHSHLKDFLEAKIPVVLCNRSREELNLPRVYPDYWTAGRMTADYLWGKGRRKLGIVSYRSAHDLPIVHSEGYRARVAELTGREMPGEALFVREGRLDYRGNELAFGKTPAFVEQMLRRLEAGALDGLFVIDEMLAVYVVKELTKRGVRIPGDLAVVGFGNTFFATVSTPTLTSVDLRNVEIGSQSAQVLLKGLRREPYPAETRLAPIIIERESA